ncbi:MAG: ABC transporter substrate-binding protein [Rhodobacter sp.]|nr:ABC transporter substrate-binding protein [Paracoccaceae bacterium]MCC0077339.1 ABC transporter substrate-binding protein [Rhodobacter sp.]
MSFTHPTRRTFLAGTAGLALGSLAAPALAQSRQQVSLAFGVPSIGGSDLGFFSSIPKGFGLYEDEGLDVEIVLIGGASAASNLVYAGQADFSTHGGGGTISAVENGVPIKAFICQIVDNIFSLGVAADSPIQSIADLRGKTIGIASVGGTPDILAHAIVAQAGLDPNADVEYLAVGLGAPALDALQRGRIDAMLSFDTSFADFEILGQQMRYFRPAPLPSIGFSHVTNASLDTIENRPEVVTGMARALARSLVYMAAADPEELAKLHFSLYPESVPSGVERTEALRIDRMRFEARKQFMRFDQRVFQRTEPLGSAAASDIELLRDLLGLSADANAPKPASDYFDASFVEAMNAIDFEADIARARAFRA